MEAIKSLLELSTVFGAPGTEHDTVPVTYPVSPYPSPTGVLVTVIDTVCEYAWVTIDESSKLINTAANVEKSIFLFNESPSQIEILK